MHFFKNALNIARAPYPAGVMDCVLDSDQQKYGLYISGLEAAQNESLMIKNQIGAVLSIGQELANVPFPKNIAHKEHTPGNQDIKGYFKMAFDFIEQYRKTTNVLVHCFVGVSRSATIIIGYIMKTKNLTFQQALLILQQRRPLINPNQGFIQQLQMYEAELFRRPQTPVRRSNYQTIQTNENLLMPQSAKRSVRGQVLRQSNYVQQTPSLALRTYSSKKINDPINSPFRVQKPGLSSVKPLKIGSYHSGGTQQMMRTTGFNSFQNKGPVKLLGMFQP